MDPLMIVEAAAFLVLVLAIVGMLAVTHGTDTRPGFGEDATTRGGRGDWV